MLLQFLCNDTLFSISPIPRMNRHGFCQASTYPPAPRLHPLLPFLSRASLPFFTENFLTHHHSLPLRQKLISQVVRAVKFDGPIIDTNELEEMEDGEFVVETCITRTLPPALTLECGLDSIEEAVEKLKLDPPPASGVFRFQVAVPPSAKALKWFCCQPRSSEVFPLFFISKEEMPTYKSLCLNETRGVFGIGAAAYFTDSSSPLNKESQSSIKRYLMNESTLTSAYGFLDVKLDAELPSVKKVSGSHHFFIPQIELAESEDASILSATLVWDVASDWNFQKELISFESCLCQASSCVPHSEDTLSISNIRSTIKALNLVESDFLPEVFSYALPLGTSNYSPNPMQLREALSSSQFCVRLSELTAVSNNMLDPDSERSIQVQNLGNVNAVWASLIIEECTRLGLTYFCIAPGSRSSPLAIAASSHPITTCIVCFDERSLAFHAVGYARGSHRPAVVVTTSGTAVSNLFPAVVEASQDFVPLLLLTADRPSELQDVGANQAINQVNHFGSFTRYFFSLPEPTDEIPARVALTALDSAVYHATSIPYGPVHVNCPFREPLDNSPKKWTPKCLNGLDLWMSNGQPFTKYIHFQQSHSPSSTHSQMAEVLNLVQGFDRGLLLLGAIQSEDDIWAALLLAKHLQWPVVADVLSGLRLRRALTSFHEVEDNIFFVDHLDHALIANSIKNWIEVDGIIQIGSKITSKRIGQMVEKCFPCPYIVVERHPCRHDPSHMISHRIQSSVTGFADSLLKIRFQKRSNSWRTILQGLNRVVAGELSFQILAEPSLTEPHVAHMISEALSDDHAIFLGNSMSIRDVDMYGYNWGKVANEVEPLFFNSKLPYQLIRVAGNRGASGIDGLLSTSAGFAVGSNKRVICLIGDVSFLHDTNGLVILSQRFSRKPMTIIVLNNHGGAIFSLLPIADNTESKVLNQYFYTSHDISLCKLCGAHGMKHVKVQTKKEFQDALHKSQYEGIDSIIEVESSIHANAITHSMLRNFSSRAADHALGMFLRFLVPSTSSPHFVSCKIMSMEYSLYRIPLRAALTSTISAVNNSEKYRQGFILFLYLEDGTAGLGEVAPLEIHEENLIDVEEQLRFLIHVVKGAKISHLLPLLKGSFSLWIWNELGIPPSSIFPSVRCGLEMAILNALAARQGSSLLSLLSSQRDEEVLSENSRGVKVCALMDPDGTPEEVARAAQVLVEEGYTAIKLKVARRADPIQDAAIIQEVRKKVGNNIELRADANRKWTYEEAICFANLVKDCNLQYIEEPVQDINDIIKFCEETGLPVALDETIDQCHEDPLKLLADYSHPGIVAAVIKPSMLGGFEKAALVARWAQKQGKMAVISSTFESGVGLSAYIIFSQYIDLLDIDTCRTMNCKKNPFTAHGLGTYQWLAEDVTTEPLNICADPDSGYVEASVDDANRLLQKFRINQRVVERKFMEERLHKYHVNMVLGGTDYSVKVMEIGHNNSKILLRENVLVFLHGFLGSSEEWIPIMKSISGAARCISIDLPGHGESSFRKSNSNEAAHDSAALSIEIVADVLSALLQQISSERITLVGYSMGARIALYMALKFPDKIKGAVLVSGSPGLKSEAVRRIRRAQDDSRARLLVSIGLESFLDSWYSGELWKSLRSHPYFGQIVAQRLKHGNEENLSKKLSELSIGRQPSLWEDLRQCKIPILLIVGQRDDKFKNIAQQMSDEINRGTESCSNIFQVPDSGHAVHLENPLPVVRALRQFFFTVLNH